MTFESSFGRRGSATSYSIIDPRDTRKVLAYVLDICRQAEQRELNANTFGVARL